jgi:hypothetical protein
MSDDTVAALITDAITAAAILNEEAEKVVAAPVVTLDLNAVEEAKTFVLDTHIAGALSDADVSVTVKLPAGDISLAPEVLGKLAETNKSALAAPVTVEVADVPMRDLSGMQAAQVKGYEAVVNIDVFVGEAKVNVPLTVSLPYKLKANENPNAVRVWHLGDNGKLTRMNGIYNKETGMVTFTVEHQSYFVVGYDPVAMWENIFRDVNPSDWYFDAVAYANYYGYVDGNNNQYKPLDNFSRATFATLIWKLEGKPVPTGKNPFKDIPDGSWYTEAVVWAAENSIVSGNGNGFNPSKLITRQEMITMLYNYLQFKGYVIPVYQVAAYSDNASVASWAANAVTNLGNAGVLSGFITNILNPMQNTNRAELAQIFMDFLRLVAGK